LDVSFKRALLRPLIPLITLSFLLVLDRHYIRLRLVASPLFGRSWIDEVVLRWWLQSLLVVTLLHTWSLNLEGHFATRLWILRAGFGVRQVTTFVLGLDSYHDHKGRAESSISAHSGGRRLFKCCLNMFRTTNTRVLDQFMVARIAQEDQATFKRLAKKYQQYLTEDIVPVPLESRPIYLSELSALRASLEKARIVCEAEKIQAREYLNLREELRMLLSSLLTVSMLRHLHIASCAAGYR
jgi:hypothetical protein